MFFTVLTCQLNRHKSNSKIVIYFRNERGRSYQAFTANHKHGITVLADYGKNPVFNFEYVHHK